MPDPLQSIVQRMIDAGESEENIATVIRHYKTAQPPEPEKPSHPLARLGYGLVNAIKDHPVETAATAGSIAAVPLTGGLSLLGGMAAAGLGAAGGAGAAIAGRQMATGRPESPTGTLGTMASQGAAGAVGEGTGRVVAGAANVIVPKLLKGILRPGKGIQQEFGDVVDVMRKERIPVGKSDTAHARMMASSQKAKGMVANAEAAGAPPVKVREVVSELGPVRDTLAKRTQLGNPNELPSVVERAKLLKARNPNGIPLSRAQELKSEAQDAAAKTYKALDRGNIVNDTGALTDKAIATGLRKSIEARVPGVAGVNSRTQGLMGLTKALEDAEARSGGVVGFNPANWLSGLAPGLGSHGAFTADAAAQASQTAKAKLFRQALLSMLAGEQGAVGPD